MFKKLFSLIFALLLFAVIMPELRAQTLQDMTVSFSDGSYNEMTGGTNLVNGDDGIVGVYFPFDYKWNGTTYTANSSIFYVSCNGFMYFQGGTYQYYYTPLNTTYPSIQAYKGDLYVRGMVSGGISGNAPNRVLILQWSNCDFYYSYGASNNFQIRLYETTNKAEIIFGSMNQGSLTLGGYYSLSMGFTASSTNYINILPGTTWNGYFSSINNASPVGPTQTISSDAINSQIKNGSTVTLSNFPSLVGTYPTSGTILQRGQIYTGAQHPALLFSRIAGQANVWAKYRISGPLPADPIKNKDYKTIYIGTAADNVTELFTFVNQPVGNPASVNVPYAKGIAAGSNGDLDLQTNSDQIVGGEYIVESQMQLPTYNYVQTFDPQTFVIALANDLAITSLTSPKSKADRKYPLSTQIPVQCRVTNLGISTYNSFTLRGVIVNTATGDTVYNNVYNWPPSGTATLTTGQYVNISLPNYRPREVTDFKLTLFVNPTNPEADDEWTNNYYPRSPEEFIFATAYEIEAEALNVIVPSDSIFVGRPVLPLARFRNNGVSDISDVPASMYIVKMVPPYDTVYRDNIIIQDIPSGRYNTSDVFFSSNFIPPSAGQYKVCINVNSIDDPVTNNNTYCELFQVVDAMAGTYTIGTTNSGSRNFASIQAAVNALYLRGVTGPVIFEFTDAAYTTGDMSLDYPAIDLSGKIIGVSSQNTITFRPSQSKALYKGSVTINLGSGNGVGVYIAQNISPNNIYAAVHGVTSGLKKVYAKSAGYIIFDGGSQKSLKFTLYTNSNFNAVFYLGQGASNCTVKNVLIDTRTTSCSDLLPLTKYDVAQSSFAYENDNRTAGTYTTGVLLRSTYPKDKNDNSNIFRLDTVVNQNNMISGNEISGFAYGVTSLGIGPLFKEGEARYQRYYNANNTITGNLIHNICRAGIYLGHEENTTVSMNKIYNVTGANGNDAYGILAGGLGTSAWFGYNNIGLMISANEINDVSSAVFAGGIKIEQSRNSYPFSNPSFVTFPNIPEASKVGNNAIWDLKTTSSNASKAGIHLLTSRQPNANWLLNMITPKVPTYYSRNDEVVNNTVWLRSDLNGVVVNNAAIGIGLQQVQNAKMYNNAVALTDEEVSLNIAAYAGYFLQGLKPSDGSLISDRNAFYSSTDANGSYFHFVEMDKLGTLIETGNRFDYKTLDQWQNWTHQDYNSVVGNFVNDLVFLGNAPNQKLRIVTNPTPLGSILNNRGNIISWVTTDIDGEPRGAAGQRYDIGHDEFNGRLFLSDMEAIKITQPVAYQSGEGFFSDAEYIMSNAPINVKGLFRNSGNLPQNSVTATLYIYRELPNGLYSNVPELTATTLVSASTTESVEANWNLADGVAPDFTPQTYSDLLTQGYVPPVEFATMQANVTPKYKIVIAIGADQNNTNNSNTKIVRFYLTRSNLRMVLSAENSFQNLNAGSTPDQIAGKLNYNALVAAFGTLGWKINLQTKQFDFDVFDRLGWEPKAVNYSMYRTMFWSDGDDAPTSRYQRIDIESFLSGGDQIEKKNLIIGSQELVRQHMTGGVNEDTYFAGEILRSNYAAPGNPLGVNVSNNGNQAIGIAIGRNYVNDILSTGFANDPEPYCGLVSIYPTGEGLSTGAFKYVNHTAAPSDSLTGVATTTLSRNVLYYAVDWRHWGQLKSIIRGSIDYIEKNGGTIIPVELVAFDAVARGKQVDLSWMTASEYNSDKFEIEKAVITESGVSAFAKIAEEKAQGQSTKQNTYGPVVDRNVDNGSTYVYRLKIVDISGEYSYSDEKQVKIGGESTSWIGSPVPNPASVEATFEYSVAEAGQVNIALYDLSGELIAEIFNGYSNAGVFGAKLNAANLVSGTYSIVMTTANQQFTSYVQIVK